MADIGPLDIFNAGLGGLGVIGSIGQSIGNFIQENKNLDYLKETQKTAWSREDNAVQRRVADLKAAGLNPVLAAGSAASSMAPIRTEAPQMRGLEGVNAAAIMANLRKTNADIAQTQASIKATEAQATKTQAEADFISKSSPYRLTSLNNEAILSDQTLQERIDTIKNQLPISELNELSKSLDTKIQTEQIDNWKLKNVADSLNYRLKDIQLSSMQKDCLIKDTALKMNDLIIKGKAKDLDWYDSDKILKYTTGVVGTIGDIGGMVK